MLLKHACAVLNTMTTVDTATVKWLRGSVGGVRVVVDVLRRQSAAGGDMRLLEHGCGALANMLRRDPESQAKCSAAGGVEVVVGLLRRPDATLLLRLWAVSVLVTLADNSQEKCGAAGAVEVLIDILRQYCQNCAPGSLHLLYSVCGVLWRLTKNHDANTFRCRAAGGVAALKAVIQAHAESKNVVLLAQLALDTQQLIQD